MRLRPGNVRQAVVSYRGRAEIAAIGRGSIGTCKREGDGATPRGRLTPIAAFHAQLPRAGAQRANTLLWRRTRPADGWCEDPASPLYNRACAAGSRHANESLARADGLYDTVVVTDHNQRPRVRRAGSAIFVHLARPGLTPTEGCLAFPGTSWRQGRVPTGTYLVGLDPRPLATRGRR